MTIALTLEWINADSYANVWTLPETEVNENNAETLRQLGESSFDIIQTIPDDAIVTLVVGINGEPFINYSVPKEEFLASEYNKNRLSNIAEGIDSVKISQAAADMIKNYIQSLVK